MSKSQKRKDSSSTDYDKKDSSSTDSDKKEAGSKALDIRLVFLILVAFIIFHVFLLQVTSKVPQDSLSRYLEV